MSFGNAILLGSGFTLGAFLISITLGAFLISIPIIIVFVLVLPALMDFVLEVLREASRP